MQYQQPAKFDEALGYIRGQKTMPTFMRTWALDKLPLEIRERAFFSAGVHKAEILDAIRIRVEGIVAGTMDRASARLELRRIILSTGYQPDPALRGGLQDLSSDRRLNLILDTNVDQARGYGDHQASQDPAILATFPCKELIRVGGFPIHPRPWRMKWVSAGGRLYAGRMIARRDDPVWMRPLSKGGFNRFGTPYPPFDFQSGMRTRNVGRSESIRLGVLDADDSAPTPDLARMNESVKARPKVASSALKNALANAGLGTFEADGSLTMNFSK